MFAKLGKISFSLFTGALLLTGCESGVFAGDGPARVTVKLTDAPGDLAEAWVKVDNVVLVRGESEDAEAADRVELTPGSVDWINLLTLTGGKAADLVTETLEPGTYEQLRLVVCEMYIRTSDGRVIATPGATLPAGVTASGSETLHLTSQCKSGFKANFPEGGVTLEEGLNTLVVDFDVQRSFAHQAGKSGKWVVTPVLHGLRLEQGGSITGTVALQEGVTLPETCGGNTLAPETVLTRFVPTATAGTTVRTGTTDAEGAFIVTPLLRGSYTLGVDPVTFSNGDVLSFTATADPATVSVESGASASASYTVTGVSCAVAPTS